MKKRIICIAALLGTFAPTAPARTLTLRFEGLRSDRGKLLVALTDGCRRHFEQLTISGGRAELTLRDIAADSLTLNAFHDENGNWRLDLDDEGLPAEGAVRTRVRPGDDDTDEVVTLRYDFARGRSAAGTHSDK